MSTAKRRYLIFATLIKLGSFIAVSFTNLYLWELTDTFSVVLKYNLGVFAGLSLGALFSGLLGERVSGKYIYSLASLFFILQMAALMILEVHVVGYLLEVGLLSGLALGTYHFATSDVVQIINSHEAQLRTKFSALRTSHTNFLRLVSFPALSLVVAQSSSYIPVFLIATVIFFLSFLFSFLVVSEQEGRGRFRLWESVQTLGRFPDLRAFLEANFLRGMQEGLYWVFLGIVTLELFGDILSWGVFLSLLYTLAIVSSHIFGKLEHAVSRKAVYVSFTFVFAFATILLSQNWDLSSFIIYQVVLIIMGVVISSDFKDYLSDIVHENVEVEGLRDEFNSLGEFAGGLGKLLVVSVLLFLGVNKLDDIVLRIGFLVVAPIPFLVISILSKTRILRAEFSN